MPLLEDKPSAPGEAARVIAHFEKLLNTLLENYVACQKQVAQLTKENEKLKKLLQGTKKSPDLLVQRHKNSKSLSPSDTWEPLMRQINLYIKEIDFCLTYFEQA